MGGTLEKTLSYLASDQILFARCTRCSQKISRHTSTTVYDNVYDPHHMYARSIYNNLSFKFRK